MQSIQLMLMYNGAYPKQVTAEPETIDDLIKIKNNDQFKTYTDKETTSLIIDQQLQVFDIYLTLPLALPVCCEYYASEFLPKTSLLKVIFLCTVLLTLFLFVTC